MSLEPGYHNRKGHISTKISSLLLSLGNLPSKYEQIAPRVEYWIEYVLREQFTTVDELVEGVSPVAWRINSSNPNVVQFLKEFRDAPHRSEQARVFVDELCRYVLRWFAITATELIHNYSDSIASCGGDGFKRAASFVGQLVKNDLLSHDLARRHLIKPLITHNDDNDGDGDNDRVNAIYELFAAAGSTLLQGLIEPKDVQLSFQIMDKSSHLDKQKVKEFRELHAKWLEQKEKEQKVVMETGDGDVEVKEDLTTVGVPSEEADSTAKTPVAFVPRDLPATTIDFPSSSSETFVDTQTSTVSSPTLSISTISDFAPTDFSEGAEEERAEPTTTRHETFYLEDGNVEILCGRTAFRVHSPIVSFSSPGLRDILSPSVLLEAAMPTGCPRITIADTAEDFEILLKMIYTPGFPARHQVPEFTVFASLLRMTAKYGYSNVRDQLMEDLKGAYPTKWEAYEAAKVLGEDVFGSPKPHPNAVLNLFSEQNIRFALPFAAYRASLGGFSALMSDKPGTILPRHTLATVTNSMHLVQALILQAAREIIYECDLGVCADRKCVLSAGIKPFEQRAEALKKLHAVFLVKRDGGGLKPLLLGDLTCAGCAKFIQAYCTVWRKAYWNLLPSTFSIARSWNEV